MQSKAKRLLLTDKLSTVRSSEGTAVVSGLYLVSVLDVQVSIELKHQLQKWKKLQRNENSIAAAVTTSRTCLEILA